MKLNSDDEEDNPTTTDIVTESISESDMDAYFDFI